MSEEFSPSWGRPPEEGEKPVRANQGRAARAGPGRCWGEMGGGGCGEPAYYFLDLRSAYIYRIYGRR